MGRLRGNGSRLIHQFFLPSMGRRTQSDRCHMCNSECRLRFSPRYDSMATMRMVLLVFPFLLCNCSCGVGISPTDSGSSIDERIDESRTDAASSPGICCPGVATVCGPDASSVERCSPGQICGYNGVFRNQCCDWVPPKGAATCQCGLALTSPCIAPK